MYHKNLLGFGVQTIKSGSRLLRCSTPLSCIVVCFCLVLWICSEYLRIEYLEAMEWIGEASAGGENVGALNTWQRITSRAPAAVPATWEKLLLDSGRLEFHY